MIRKLSLALTALLAACVPAAPPAPAPAPSPSPVPVPPPPAPTPYAGDWRDWAVTPGAWVYRQDGRGSIALFGPVNGDALFTLRCDRIERRIYLSRAGAAPGNVPLTIRTSSTVRGLPALPTGGVPAYMASALAPADPLLDAMAFSRGRFIVEMPPMPPLVVPAWAEVPRVVEDCR